MENILIKYILTLLILIILIILINKKPNNNYKLSMLKARFTALTDGTPVLQISYINPVSFGDNANFKNIILYLTECVDKCPDDIDHPTIDQLTTGNLNKSVIVNIAYIASDPSIASGKVLLNIPVSNLNISFGKTYKIGIGIYTDKKSILGSEMLPNIYGDFNYITISFMDPKGPGKVNSLVSSFV